MRRQLVLVTLIAWSSLASADPKKLAYRYLHVGRALGAYDVTTYALDLDGAKAELRVTRAVSDPAKKPLDETGPYRPGATETYTGTVSTARSGLRLAFEHAGGKPFERLACRWKTVPIAGATAVRTKTPGEHGECDGDRGVWSPAKTTKKRVLSCGADDELVFGELPGIERATLSEECYIQGAGLRAIGRDGAIQRVSAKH